MFLYLYHGKNPMELYRIRHATAWTSTVNIHQVGKLPHRSFSDLSRTYGPIMRLKFGRLNTVIITSSEAAREVLRTHDHILSGRMSPNAVRFINHHKVSVAWIHPSSARWRYFLLLIIFYVGFCLFFSQVG